METLKAKRNPHPQKGRYNQNAKGSNYGRQSMAMPR
ncbi:hypothetical protein CWATWH0402_842 [Crocosphaera watsonii WH 0402]|uniref:Uncharacterized protein n=1 Tax=Crocosphaera watsonii WH 0402 TaxID=1284629 RepID=T2JUP4_CROWT|nr:hypothetical protein CWATWH0402_842 [Crocosphaera watsonii WH 0402]